MTLFEILFYFVLIGAIWLGATWGYGEFSWIGLAVGGLIGGLAVPGIIYALGFLEAFF